MKCEVPGETRAPASRLDEDGFEVLPKLLSAAQCESLLRDLYALFKRQQASARTRLGGLRNLLRTAPAVEDLANSELLKGILASRVDRAVRPVRALFFDKTPDANWSVPWHQDVTIAVAQRIETPGFSGWSAKHGVVHVQPPGDVLERMVAVRLHLDACAEENGALKVIPGSHRHGKLEAAAIDEWTRRPVHTCAVPSGGALVMRPLLLHASSPAKAPSHRRVLHLEYTTAQLPHGLEWFVS
jgi:hypothetical protein